MTVPVTIELYGIPRARAGLSEFATQATTVQEALAALAVACPALGELCRPDGRMASHYLLSLGGHRFLADLSKPLKAGDRLLLLSADAGG
jgi:molybdopterin converting factor small subunit